MVGVAFTVNSGMFGQTIGFDGFSTLESPGLGIRWYPSVIRDLDAFQLFAGSYSVLSLSLFSLIVSESRWSFTVTMGVICSNKALLATRVSRRHSRSRKWSVLSSFVRRFWTTDCSFLTNWSRISTWSSENPQVVNEFILGICKDEGDQLVVPGGQGLVYL